MKKLIFSILTVVLLTTIEALPAQDGLNDQRLQDENNNFGRIYGGNIAGANQFPYHVALILNLPNGTFYICGGSIIAPRVILTAAHCVHNNNAPKEIIAGTNDPTNAKIRRKVLKEIVHENFRKIDDVLDPVNNSLILQGKIDNDIALLILDKPLEFNGEVQPIEFPSEEIENDSRVTIIGWGLSNENPHGVSTHLKYNLNLKVADKAFCLYGDDEADDKLCLARGGKGDGSCAVRIFSLYLNLSLQLDL